MLPVSFRIFPALQGPQEKSILFRLHMLIPIFRGKASNATWEVAYISSHGLRTPNEGINQRYLKNWADVADKICFGRT